MLAIALIRLPGSPPEDPADDAEHDEGSRDEHGDEHGERRGAAGHQDVRRGQPSTQGPRPPNRCGAIRITKPGGGSGMGGKIASGPT